MRHEASWTSSRNCRTRSGRSHVTPQATRDDIPTFWTTRETLPDILKHLKTGCEQPYPMLYDLTAIDERVRGNRQDQPESDFTVVYHLLSFDRNQDVRIKVPLRGGRASPSRASPDSGRPRTGTNARSGTCSGSTSKDIPICGAS